MSFYALGRLADYAAKQKELIESSFFGGHCQTANQDIYRRFLEVNT
jgi:hypothetical protein